MLLSYLKLAWKVLLRRKFFTFVSLFGISFTLMVLLVVYAFYDSTMGPHRPELRTDRLLFINEIQLDHHTGERSSSSLGYAFINRHVRTLRRPERMAICEEHFNPTVAYAGQQAVKLDLLRTDGEFWRVLDFDFVAGRPYNADEVRAAARVAVVNETSSRRWFGTTSGAVGRTVELGAGRYRVVGVVRDVSIMRLNTYADVWTPVTTSPRDLRDPQYAGAYQVIVLARRPADVPGIQEEYEQLVRRLPVPDPKQYSGVQSYARPLLAAFTSRLVSDSGSEGGVSTFVLVLLGLGLLFMLLPAVNLVNINLSRTLERSSEIGVRKAFGATAGRLVGQFLVENIFLTLLGGALGLALAAGVLHLVNESHFIPYSDFALNGRVFAAALGVALFFGVLSGAYPAYKMARLQAVDALKRNPAA